MAQTQHCGDWHRHHEHYYWGPGRDGSKQVEFYCPGTR
jgi:hypothetical protein